MTIDGRSTGGDDVRRRIQVSGLVIISTFAVAAGEIAYPLYPSPHSLCGLLEERVKILSQVEEHHRGAVLLVSGDVLAGPDGPTLFSARCGEGEVQVSLEVPETVLSSTQTLGLVRSLRNPNFMREDRTVPVEMVARVEANVNACFAPGTVLKALAIHATGPLRVRARPKWWLH
jgi:hypothetical protein